MKSTFGCVCSFLSNIVLRSLLEKIYHSFWRLVINFDYFSFKRSLSNFILPLKLSDHPRVFYLTGSSTTIYFVMQTVLLRVALRFQTPISAIYDSKEVVQFKHQS